MLPGIGGVTGLKFVEGTRHTIRDGSGEASSSHAYAGELCGWEPCKGELTEDSVANSVGGGSVHVVPDGKNLGAAPRKSGEETAARSARRAGVFGLLAQVVNA